VALFRRSERALPPTGARVAVRLPSGRTVPVAVVRADDDELVLDHEPSPHALPVGSLVQVGWSTEAAWYVIDATVLDPGRMPVRLRVRPARRAEPRHDRRRGRRRQASLHVVEVRVERAAAVMPGSSLRAWVDDLSPRGLSFLADVALERGDRVTLELYAEGAWLGRVEATVVRGERPPGSIERRIAVAFEQPSETLREVLAEP
jgi:hypothetical protein